MDLYEFDGKKLEICPSDVDFFPKFRTLRPNNIFDQRYFYKVLKGKWSDMQHSEITATIFMNHKP